MKKIIRYYKHCYINSFEILMNWQIPTKHSLLKSMQKEVESMKRSIFI